ncbi:MAG: hypothetical protein KC486_24720, partial [Myxococcales bacterium]|nr:hypothetical protein [Myxococcales bacterium]
SADERAELSAHRDKVKALEDRVATLKRQLDDEVEAHRASCRRHSDELDALRERDAKRRKRRLGGAIGAGIAGLIATVVLRRR